jgi:hypothetical protein
MYYCIVKFSQILFIDVEANGKGCNLQSKTKYPQYRRNRRILISVEINTGLFYSLEHPKIEEWKK